MMPDLDRKNMHYSSLQAVIIKCISSVLSLTYVVFVSAYRLLGRRSLSAKRLVVSSKVLFPAIPTQNCDVVLTFPAETEDATLMWLLARLKSRAPSLTVHVRHHSHTGIYGFYLTALYEKLVIFQVQANIPVLGINYAN